MCLVLGKDEMGNSHNRLSQTKLMDRLKRSKNGKILCWKIYSRRNKCLRTKYLKSVHRSFSIYGPGIVKSDRKSKKLTCCERDLGTVYKGIHVFTIPVRSDFDAVVPVWCNKEDLVAVNYDGEEAVFMKVEITPNAFKKALKGKRNV